MMPKDLDVGEVSISSGSMSYTFDLVTAQRFSSSLSRTSVPHSSAQALRRQKTFNTAVESYAWRKKMRWR